MRYAFSREGLRQLRALHSRRSLLAFDFDGTLAPITNRPEQARMRPLTAELLGRLSQVAPTAAITGRSLINIRQLVPPTLQAWAGNHGAEIFPFAIQNRTHGETRRQVKRWAASLRNALSGLPGVFVEEKELSLAVHFRASPRKAQARRLILSAVAGLEPGPRVLAGKCVVNVLDPNLPHKGQAIQAILRALRFTEALYVGDDENDEDVFALASPRVLSVRVGKKKGSRATLYLRNQKEIDRLLRCLLLLRAAS